MKINDFNVAAHFAGKDSTTREIYDRLLKTSRQSGTVKEDPKKTSIHLVNKTAFAGVAVARTRSCSRSKVIENYQVPGYTNPSKSRPIDFIMKSNWLHLKMSMLN